MDQSVNNNMTGTILLGDKVLKKKTAAPVETSLLETIIFLAAIFLIVYGWQYRAEEIFTAEKGWGYALGIVGSVLMLILMLYPMRKHSKFMRNWGPVRYWFRTHMILGVIGPIAILYHANFGLGSINSNVALVAMITVAVSGLFGRFFYHKIHKGLYGKKSTFKELEDDFKSNSIKFSNINLDYTEHLLTSLESFNAKYKKIANNVILGIALLPMISILSFIRSLRVKALLKKNIARDITENKLSKADAKTIKRAINKGINNYLSMSCKVIEYIVYERIFSLWHMLHLPLFIIMLFTGIFHVYAVHMY